MKRLLIFLMLNTAFLPLHPFDYVCKAELDKCPCLTQTKKLVSGFCVPDSQGKLYCKCNWNVLTAADVIALQKKRFDEAAPELFYLGMGERPSDEIVQKLGAEKKAALREKLETGAISWYSKELPIGVRLDTDEACGFLSKERVCDYFRKMLLEVQLGRDFRTLEDAIPLHVFKQYMGIIDQLCTEIQRGRFNPDKTDNIARAGPCKRFIQMIEQNGLRVLAKEKQLIEAACDLYNPSATGQTNETKYIGDPCRCTDGSTGTCQVNKWISPGKIWCHCD